MSAADILKRIEDAGISLKPNGDKLQYFADHDLTAEQIEYLRRHKQLLLEHLTAVSTATARLSELAERFDHPLSDLLDWYRDDLEEIGRADLETVRAWVADYLQYHKWYRRPKRAI